MTQRTPASTAFLIYIYVCVWLDTSWVGVYSDLLWRMYKPGCVGSDSPSQSTVSWFCSQVIEQPYHLVPFLFFFFFVPRHCTIADTPKHAMDSERKTQWWDIHYNT